MPPLTIESALDFHETSVNLIRNTWGSQLGSPTTQGDVCVTAQPSSGPKHCQPQILEKGEINWKIL